MRYCAQFVSVFGDLGEGYKVEPPVLGHCPDRLGQGGLLAELLAVLRVHNGFRSAGK